MNNKIKLISIEKLKCHEEVIPAHVEEIKKKIMAAGSFTKPIIVAKNSMVILDGHHRFNAMKELGFRKIPAQLVDYNKIKVYLRRKNLLMDIIRKTVILSAKEGKLFPNKTTRHFIENRVMSVKYSLSSLYE